jgi:hypothetical protein
MNNQFGRSNHPRETYLDTSNKQVDSFTKVATLCAKANSIKTCNFIGGFIQKEEIERNPKIP